MKIPVFHDDQHGTAIISGAALLNALELAGKRIEEVRVVFNGAGASGIACATLYERLGVRRENIVMCDTKGVIYRGRTNGMNPYKERFARRHRRAHAGRRAGGRRRLRRPLGRPTGHARDGALDGADPMIFAMANPDPEITYDEAVAGAARRHHGHRPLGLPQPGQQRPRLPVHLPRRPRRARHHHQR
jgi:malate dehydrogenase (oxaloacetate-decarboxylating)(NADP+)